MVQAKADSERPAVVALLLAAGHSRRFGPRNKLLAAIAGEPLVRLTARALLASRARSLVVVTGFERERVAAALDGLDLQLVYNPDHAGGLGTSLARGIAAAPDWADGALVCLADMPGTTAASVDRLIDTFAGAGGGKIVYPVGADGRQGNPVLWPRRFFGDLAALCGDAGAKALLTMHRSDTLPVEVTAAGAFDDVDTEGDLAAWPPAAAGGGDD